MVSDREIQASNALINDATAPRVSVFVGGTSGIGKFTIEALVATGASVRIYLVGRQSSAERTKTFIDQQHAVNPKAEIVWTEGEISLLADTKRICEEIKAKESRIDLLFLSAGYVPFGGRHETSEGREVVQSLEVYSRQLFTKHLLPLLQKSETGGRVVSVMAGGLEKAQMDLDDLDLKNTFGVIQSRRQNLMMTTLALDKLADDHPDVTFVHSYPGSVDTGNALRGIDRKSYSLITWVVLYLLVPLIHLVSMKDEVSGQRHLFESTSAFYGGRGIPWKGEQGMNSRGKEANGLFLVNDKGNCTPNQKNVTQLRESSRDVVWEHIQNTLQPYV